MNNPLEIEMTIEDLDHLGLVAGLIDEIGIVIRTTWEREKTQNMM